MRSTINEVGNHCEVGHFRKNNEVTPPESRSNELKCLLCMGRKMDHDGEFAKQYGEMIQNNKSKRYAKT